jgi:hypothetical protein
MASRRIKYVFAIFLVLIIFLGFYISINQGRFTLTDTSSISRDSLEFSEPIYLGNNMRWRGLFKPKILNIKLMDKNNSFINIQDSSIEVFLVDGGHIGVLTESEVYSKIDIIPPNNFNLKNKNINIVFRIDSKSDEQFIDNLSNVWIDYSIFGISKFQIIGINLINE